MFSPDVGGPSSSASLRNPRRRQRNLNEDSVKLPKAKRQRSALRDDTFTPLEDTDVNAISGQANGEASINGHATAPPPTPASTRQTRSSRHTTLQELAFRPHKKQEKRSERSDGGVTLSKNDFYSISQLPSLPDSIRSNGITSFNAVVAPEYGYALTLTQTQALVWSYDSSTSSPPSKDMFSFDLPNASKSASDPLPLGSFVARSSSSQPGLVVVAPISGKITYWEDISNAAIPGLGREKQNGFQGSVGLLHGEVVTTIENAEPAGFILTLSSSRVAHLTVRDPQGKPAVNIQFLRGSGGGLSGGGLFGSVRSMFGGGAWRKDVAAVRAGRTRQRGQRDVIVATRTGTFELWDAFWSIGDSMRGQVDAKEVILNALRPAVAFGDPQHAYHFQILDFAFAVEPKDKMELVIAGPPTSLVVLALLADEMSVNYYLIELTLDNEVAEVDVVHPITCYRSPLQHQTSWRPRIVIPKPGNMAFVIFETTIVLFSLTRVKDSPESQLAFESGAIPAPFQDCVEFRNDSFQVKALGVEDQGQDHKFPSCVLMIEGYGMIRVLSYPQKESEGIQEPAQITAKSKIEQAVFFGGMIHNPLDFSAREEQQFSMQEINEAALAIHNEILQSSSIYLPSVTPTLENQLRLRAKALEDLAAHLKRQYPLLPRTTRWMLLNGAEKMAASRALWAVEEDAVGSKKKNEKTLLSMMITYIHENYKSPIDPSKGENDPLRHWFTYDTGRIGTVIPWTFQALKEAYQDGVRSQKDLNRRMSESTNIALAVVNTAFEYRQNHVNLYGLGDETLVDGVLTGDMQGLPEFWTSSKLGVEKIFELLRNVQQTVNNDLDEEGSEMAAPEVVEKLRFDTPRLVQMYSQMVEERYRWCLAQEDPKVRDAGEQLEANHTSERSRLIVEVGKCGLLEDAIALAVKYKDMETLVELVLFATDVVGARKGPGLSEDEDKEVEAELKSWNKRVSSYFDKFGDDWAQAWFMRHISDGLLGTFMYQTDYQPYLTRFFERNPQFEKLTWMNDIVGEADYRKAAEHLNNLALDEENIWSKKVELSLGKLAELAYVEEKFTGKPEHRLDNAKNTINSTLFKQQAALLDIQDLLYSHIQPMISGAIDETAELQLVYDGFASDGCEDTPTLKSILQGGLKRLLAREVMTAEEMIDVLTLMDVVTYPDHDESDVVGHEFYLALRCLNFSDLDSARKAVQEKIIWRRCMIGDDWIKINKTVKKDDRQVEAETSSTALFRTLKEGLQNATFPDPRFPKFVFHPLSPSAVLGQATEPDAFAARFPDNDQRIREAIAEDVKGEDVLLKQYMKEGRLEKWYPGILEAAQRAVREEAAERRESRRRDGGLIDDSSDEGATDEKTTSMNGEGVKLLVTAKVPDPAGGNGQMAIPPEETDQDADGDVQMDG